MSTPINPQQNQTTYAINPEDASETGRLLLQDRLLTEEMGSLFPPHFSPTPGQIILDLACGPGGWALDVAQAYPDIDVIGVDISTSMIRYAQAQAQALHVGNITFKVMDILKPLDFPDAAFEFVNTRWISGFMPKDAWPKLLQQCSRITRPSGIIRCTEFEYAFSNGEASEKIAHLIKRALWLDGKTFGPHENMIGITLMLRRFLCDAELTNINHDAYLLDYSFGMPAHETQYHNLMMAYRSVVPYLLKLGVTTQEEFDSLYDQFSLEFQHADFCGLIFMRSVWGKKPEC